MCASSLGGNQLAVTTPRRADRFPAAKVDLYMFYGFSWIGDVGFGRWARAGCSVENAWAIGPVGRRPASASGAPRTPHREGGVQESARQ